MQKKLLAILLTAVAITLLAQEVKPPTPTAPIQPNLSTPVIGTAPAEGDRETFTPKTPYDSKDAENDWLRQQQVNQGAENLTAQYKKQIELLSVEWKKHDDAVRAFVESERKRNGWGPDVLWDPWQKIWFRAHVTPPVVVTPEHPTEPRHAQTKPN